jgi:hypothetical protein
VDIELDFIAEKLAALNDAAESSTASSTDLSTAAAEESKP